MPPSQRMLGYKKPYRKDRNIHGGGILVYVRDDIPCKELNHFDIGGNTEGIFVELNFRKSKWLLLAAYKPPDVPKNNCFDNTEKRLQQKQLSKYSIDHGIVLVHKFFFLL